MMREAELDTIVGDWDAPLPVARMKIFRNNVVGALISALEVRYPVVAAIAGPDVFRAMAAGYAAVNRPASPVLIEYGGSFPNFVRLHVSVSHLPYLADTAELESLWWQSYHSADVEPLRATALAGLSPEEFSACRFAFHPSVQLTSSPYAVASIWQACRDGEADLAGVNIDTPHHVLIARPHVDVSVFAISRAHFAFLRALKARCRLSEAVNAALDIEESFDLNRHIEGLFGLGLLSELIHDSPC